MLVEELLEQREGVVVEPLGDVELGLVEAVFDLASGRRDVARVDVARDHLRDLVDLLVDDHRRRGPRGLVVHLIHRAELDHLGLRAIALHMELDRRILRGRVVGVFVDVGSVVGESTTVCIIEAMKLMNEIPAETRGVIAEALVENGKPVEFGTRLFKVRRA